MPDRGDAQIALDLAGTGARVLLLYDAANRTEALPDPDGFRIDRDPGERVESIELAGDPSWGQNPALRGLSLLPLRLRPA